VPVLKNCIAGAIEAATVEMPSARYKSAHELAKRGLSVSPAAASDTGKPPGGYKERLRAPEGQE